MNKHLQAFRTSILAGAVSLLIFIIVLTILGSLTLTLILFGFNIVIDSDAFALIITILVVVVTAVHIYEVGRLDQAEDRNKRQSGLLIILLEELDFLAGNLRAYVATLSKPDHYPLYELWQIDTSLYLSGLNHRIKGREVLDLKRNVMKIKDKIILINNMMVEMRTLEEGRGKEEIIKIIKPGKIIRGKIIKIIENEILSIISHSKERVRGLLKQ